MKVDYIITRDLRVGKNKAEADDLLTECFIDNAVLKEVLDIGLNTSILLGRTGAGKSALIRRIKETKENILKLALENKFMSYISNSDIVRYLKTGEANLSLLFQAMWKHILVIEYIKLKYHVDSKEKAKNIIDKIIGLFKEQDTEARQQAEQYFGEYENSLWEETDAVAREWLSSQRDAAERAGCCSRAGR